MQLHAMFRALLGLCAALLLTSCSRPSTSTPEALLVEKLDVERQMVDFGELAINQVVRETLIVENVGKNTVHLLEPERECGCSQARFDRLELKPGESASLELELSAPGSPGRVEKRVWLACREISAARLPVTLVANVSAAVWSQPSSLTIEVSPNQEASRNVVLRHLPGRSISKLECPRPEVSVSTVSEGELVREVQVNVPSGNLEPGEVVESQLAVFLEAESEPTLRIPVRYRLRSPFRFSPDKLTLVPHQAAIHRTVSLLMDPDVSPDSLQVESLVKAVTVESQRFSRNRLIIQLRLDTTELAEGAASVLQAKVSGREPAERLVVHVLKSS